MEPTMIFSVLHEISWPAYATTVILFLIAYYAVIVFLYYRHDLLLLLEGNRQSDTNKQMPTGQSLVSDHGQTQANTIERSLLDEISAYLANAADEAIDSNTLIVTVQQIIAKYSIHQVLSIKNEVEQAIANYCREHLSIVVTNERMATIWSPGK